uniref:Uncharacterized protein n=1 Tax=Hordeum vulgare subsp. vulgare TaxID=112509 RepID=A0A8I7BFV4_HORVV
MIHMFQKRCENAGDTSFDPLVYADFYWANDWVDPTIPLPQSARGCLDDISWEYADVVVGASVNLHDRNLPRTGNTLRRGASRVQVKFERQSKRPTTTRPTLLEVDGEEEDLEQEQHSSNPSRNEEEDDSDYMQDDDDVSNDDEDPTNDDQDGEDNTNATMDEFDDGY